MSQLQAVAHAYKPRVWDAEIEGASLNYLGSSSTVLAAVSHHTSEEKGKQRREKGRKEEGKEGKGREEYGTGGEGKEEEEKEGKGKEREGKGRERRKRRGREE